MGIIAAVMSKRGIGPGETQDTETDTRLEVARKTARMNTHENGEEIHDLEMEEQAGPSNSHSWKGRLRNNKSREIPSTAPSKISSKAAAKVSKAPSSRGTPSDGPSTASKATSTSRNKKKKNTPTKSTIAPSNEKNDQSMKDQSDHMDHMEIPEEEDPDEELDPEMVKAAIEWNNQRDRDSDMAVYMDRFEKYEVASILKEHFPTKVPDFLTEESSTRKVSTEALALATALVNKATLLHLAHLPSLSAKFQKPPACSPQVLAYLTYLSAKIAEPSLSPTHLEETMKLFSDFEPTYGPLVLLDILQDEIGHLRFITGAELEKRLTPKEDIPEILFDDLLRFKDVLETDCKVFLVLFLGPTGYNSQDIVEE